MSAGIEVKEFKHIPGKNDAEYIKLLEEHSERWKQIANSAIAKVKRMSAEGPKHGKWKPRYYDVGADVYVEWACSECGYVRQKGREDGDAGEEPEAKFCENCGAKMER